MSDGVTDLLLGRHIEVMIVMISSSREKDGLAAVNSEDVWDIKTITTC